MLRREQLRLRRVDRQRVAPIPARVAQLLPAAHSARLVWDATARLDVTAFYAPLGVVAGGPGHAATDPQILVALWLYATSQGVTSARALNDLCVEHLAYSWLCGGVSMNYHTLSDFRTPHLPALDALLTQVVGCLDYAGSTRLKLACGCGQAPGRPPCGGKPPSSNAWRRPKPRSRP